MTPERFDTDITAFSHSIMRGVVNSTTGKILDLDLMVDIMRDEVKAFFLDTKYADERAAILARSVSETTVKASIVASIMIRYRESGGKLAF